MQIGDGALHLRQRAGDRHLNPSPIFLEGRPLDVDDHAKVPAHPVEDGRVRLRGVDRIQAHIDGIRLRNGRFRRRGLAGARRVRRLTFRPSISPSL